jgi:hypothetical protein
MLCRARPYSLFKDVFRATKANAEQPVNEGYKPANGDYKGADDSQHQAPHWLGNNFPTLDLFAGLE